MTRKPRNLSFLKPDDGNRFPPEKMKKRKTSTMSKVTVTLTVTHQCQQHLDLAHAFPKIKQLTHFLHNQSIYSVI
jgi:hypothetical protein